jgi:hypothetical protein
VTGPETPSLRGPFCKGLKEKGGKLKIALVPGLNVYPSLNIRQIFLIFGIYEGYNIFLGVIFSAESSG